MTQTKSDVVEQSADNGQMVAKAAVFTTIPMWPAFIGFLAFLLLVLSWGVVALFGDRMSFRDIVHDQTIIQVVFYLVAALVVGLAVWVVRHRARLARIFR